ncbi:hypothetical protein FOZ62_026956, partial [Perkinsus olseni]
SLRSSMSRDTTIFPCRTGPMDREVVVGRDQSPENEAPRAAAVKERPLEKRTLGLQKSGIDFLEEACRRMGKAPEEEAPWRQYLKDQWLDGRGALASLSEAEWAKLEIPIGLRSELRKLISEYEEVLDRPRQAGASSLERVGRTGSSGSERKSSGNAQLDGFRNFESPSWGGVDFSNKLTEMHGKKEMNKTLEELRKKLKSRSAGDIYSL